MSSTEICKDFLANNWKKDLCINCQRHVSEHEQDIKLQRSISTEADPSTDISVTQVDSTSAGQLPSKQKVSNTTTSPARSKLPTRSLSCKPPTTSLPSNSSSPKPKKVALVKRSESELGSRPPTAVKPQTLRKPQSSNKQTRSNKPASLQQALKKPATFHQALDKPAGLQPAADKPATANKPEVGNKPQAAVKPQVINISSADTADNHYHKPSSAPLQVNTLVNNMAASVKSTSQEGEDSRPTLVDRLNSEELSDTQNSFVHYKNYSEHLHESSFHKLTEKEHQQRKKHKRFVPHTQHNESNTKQQPTSSLYDNATPPPAHPEMTQSEHNGVTPPQQRDLPQVSPKYDPVAQGLTTSQESERIYAEVTDDFIKPGGRGGSTANTTSFTGIFNEYELCNSSAMASAAGRMHSSMAEYEELTDYLSPQATKSKKCQTMPATNEISDALATAGIPASSPQPTARSGKMAFLKTLLKKGKKAESIGNSAGQKLETLDRMPSLCKDRQMAVVDSWVKEQNNANKLEVDTTPSPTSAERTRMLNSDSKSTSIRSSLSPNSIIQRPDKKPPPPPTEGGKQQRRSYHQQSIAVIENSHTQLTVNNNIASTEKSPNKLLLIKGKNGEFSPIAPDPNQKKVKVDNRPDAMYDAPWGNVDEVISSIIKTQMDKSGGSVSKSVRSDGPTKSNLKRLQIQHGKQASLPDSRTPENLKRCGKTSPSSATDSGYGSTSTITTVVSRGHSNASDMTHHRLSMSSAHRNSSGKSTPIDSIPLCLEQIGVMNSMGLQRIVKAFAQKASVMGTDQVISWSNILLSNEGTTPTHCNKKCVFYEATLKDKPCEPITVMISLKEPVACKTYTPNLTCVNQTFSANVDKRLIPEQMLKKGKSGGSQSSTDSSLPGSRDSNSSGEATTSDNAISDMSIHAYVTVMHHHPRLTSVTDYIKSRAEKGASEDHLALDALFILLQVINIIFSLAERQKQMESLSAGDLVVSLDSDSVPTVFCHMLSVKKVSTDFNLTCEKLKMLVIQLTHTFAPLSKHKQFKTIEDLIQNSSDAGDLRTIALIVQYVLWGPKDDEVKVMNAADNRKQAFELWLHLSRATLLNELALKPMDKLKVQMMADFLANTSGHELFRITKLLGTY